MNEKLQEAVVEMIGRANNGVDASVSFLSAELPDYIMQMLAWYGLKSFILWVGAIIFVYVYYRLVSSIEGDVLSFTTPVARDIAIAFGGAVAVAASVSVFTNLTWLKIWVAPKVWLVEYAATLVK